MIKSLHLKNWQCHEDRLIELDKITVLVGDNDAGKSAVIRALKWVALNIWDGEANTHVTWDKEQSEVSLEINKDTVVRAKGKKTNKYTLNGRDLEFDLSRSTPTPVVKCIRLSADNFQDQGDPAFWLSLTSGAASLALNQIFNLSAVDNSLSNIASQLREARSKVSVSEERLEKGRKERDNLKWVVESNKQLQELETLSSEIQDIEDEIDSLKELQVQENRLKKIERTIAAASTALKKAEEVRLLDTQIEQLKTLSALETQQKEIEGWLKTKTKELSILLKGECPLCGRR